MTYGGVNCSIICIFNVGKTQIPLGWGSVMINPRNWEEGIVNNFSLTINLWMKDSGKINRSSKYFPKGMPKMAHKT
jgi:hypothetical protein